MTKASPARRQRRWEKKMARKREQWVKRYVRNHQDRIEAALAEAEPEAKAKALLEEIREIP